MVEEPESQGGAAAQPPPPAANGGAPAVGSFLRGTDTFAWHMEQDPVLRSTAVALTFFDRSPEWDQLVARIDYMTRAMPSLRQRVVESAIPFVPPRWTYVSDIDLQWHLRRMQAPAPYTQDTVLEVARQAAMDAFDKARPLWEFTLVEGLRDDDGTRAALVMKVHHSMSDGVGGMRLLGELFDMQREAEGTRVPPPVPLGEDIGRLTLAREALGSALGGAARAAPRWTASAVAALPRAARNPLGAVRSAAAMAASVYRFAAPILRTKSPVMQERALGRRVATMAVPLDDLKKAAAAAGGTVNDAYLAALTGGLRRYHERHGASVESLRVTLPINLRAEDDTTRYGNLITLQRVTVPVGEPDPRARMRLLHPIIEAARHEPSVPITGQITRVLDALPVEVIGSMLKHVDFLASNVPSSPVQVYLAGARVTGFYAFGPTIGSAFNVTMISYGGECDIGINIDTAAVPDPEVLLDCLEEGFAEVADLDTTASPGDSAG